MDQQNSHGQPSQAHDLYVHGNNTAANAGIADPQYHTHSHMHRKYFFLQLDSFFLFRTIFLVCMKNESESMKSPLYDNNKKK